MLTVLVSAVGTIVTPVSVLPSVKPGIVVVDGAPELVDGGTTGGTTLEAWSVVFRLSKPK
jgi:hypothetical protein